jgi:hypothetical protein
VQAMAQSLVRAHYTHEYAGTKPIGMGKHHAYRLSSG